VRVDLFPTAAAEGATAGWRSNHGRRRACNDFQQQAMGGKMGIPTFLLELLERSKRSRFFASSFWKVYAFE